jgi:hypothetical protein
MGRWERVLAGVVVLTCAVGTAGCGAKPAATPSSSPAPTLPGTAGHFDDGSIAFDYPSSWPVIAGPHSAASRVTYVLAVLGNGSWQENCQTSPDGSVRSCGLDTVSFPPGGIVVKIYRYYGGPAPICRGDVQANATFGPNAVRKTADGSTTSWELRPPGNEFGQPNNVFIEAHTDDSAQLATAESIVASFRWIPGGYPGTNCPSPGTS